MAAKLNKAQQMALKALYDRAPIYAKKEDRKPISYLQFRRTVQPGYDCAMVQWAGMWIGIEPDGYTHS